MHSGSPMFAGLNFKDVLYFKNGSSLAASGLGGISMRIITEKLQLQPNERFVLCDHCNTSFVANYNEAFDRLEDTTFDDEVAYDYTFVCPCCGVHQYVLGVSCDD